MGMLLYQVLLGVLPHAGRAQGLGFRFRGMSQGSGFRIEVSGLMDSGSGFRAYTRLEDEGLLFGCRRFTSRG